MYEEHIHGKLQFKSASRGIIPLVVSTKVDGAKIMGPSQAHLLLNYSLTTRDHVPSVHEHHTQNTYKVRVQNGTSAGKTLLLNFPLTMFIYDSFCHCIMY